MSAANTNSVSSQIPFAYGVDRGAARAPAQLCYGQREREWPPHDDACGRVVSAAVLSPTWTSARLLLGLPLSKQNESNRRIARQEEQFEHTCMASPTRLISASMPAPPAAARSGLLVSVLCASCQAEQDRHVAAAETQRRSRPDESARGPRVGQASAHMWPARTRDNKQKQTVSAPPFPFCSGPPARSNMLSLPRQRLHGPWPPSCAASYP